MSVFISKAHGGTGTYGILDADTQTCPVVINKEAWPNTAHAAEVQKMVRWGGGSAHSP